MISTPDRKRHSTRAAALKLALSIAALVMTVGVIGVTTGTLPNFGQQGSARCRDSGASTSPGTPDTWVHLASTAPADIITAMQSSPGYGTPLQLFDFDPGTPYSFPDAPVLVKPATCGGGEYYSLPHFIVRAAINGVRRVTYDLVYDPGRQMIRISSVGIGGPTDPAYGKPFPWEGVTAQAAIAALQSVRGLALAPGAAPELVFFTPPDPGPPGSMTPWLGGGEDPAHPIWRLKGADGRYHFVGTDGRVYEPNQLPIRPGTSVIQP